ncbi:hypothetical protein A2U01_0065675, partial [Trifolium medium]|nr:hypothetical protein [Trifolium medium]
PRVPSSPDQTSSTTLPLVSPTIVLTSIVPSRCFPSSRRHVLPISPFPLVYGTLLGPLPTLGFLTADENDRNAWPEL